MLQLIVILKALVEIASVGMLGQGLLHVLAGRGRDQNLVYRVFKTITSPVTKLARIITPRIVLDRHIWLVSTLLLAVLWLTLTVLKINLVLQGTAGG